METFKDLTTIPHPNSDEGQLSFSLFDNGRGISVVSGAKYFQTSEEAPYEVGFIKENGKLGKVYLEGKDLDKKVILVEDKFGNDVAGYCTEEDVTLIMEAIQKL